MKAYISAPSGPDIPSDAFLGLGLAEAAKKYLGMVRQKKTTREIAAALEQGGIVNRAKSFYSTVFTALKRASKGGGIVKIGNEWGLAEWYPRHGSRQNNMKSISSTSDNQASASLSEEETLAHD